MTELIQGVGLLVQILAFAIFARAILSWFPIDTSPTTRPWSDHRWN